MDDASSGSEVEVLSSVAADIALAFPFASIELSSDGSSVS
jgi:hypothetical protein